MKYLITYVFTFFIGVKGFAQYLVWKEISNKEWTRDIRRKFFPGEGPTPLKSKLIPLGGKK